MQELPEIEQNHHILPEIKIVSTRKALNYASFKNEYEYIHPKQQDAKQVVGSALHTNCNPESCCNLNNLWNFANQRIPALNWCRKYNVRKNIGNDIIAGITVGIMHIPHGMAFGILANVSPVTGLYVSFFPVLVYFLLGTSRHVSIGTFSVICIMLGKSVEDVLDKRPDIISNATNLTGILTENEAYYRTQAAIEVVMAICFVVGIVQMAFGIFQLGALSVFLSDILVSGFTTGTAVQVVTGQIKHLLGIKFQRRNGLFKVAYEWIDVFSSIQSLNYISVIISAIAISSLEIVNRFVNPRFQAKFRFFIPIELIVIILGTTAYHVGTLESSYNIKVVGTIPTGIPTPRAIRWDLLPDVAVQSVPIAIVSFTIMLSLSQLLAKKGGYKVNANQDLFAIGTANLVSSFFSCYPCSVSLSRSLLQFSTGGKTQIASLVSSIFLMTILLSIGPLFQELPYCILASVIVVSISKMFRQVQDAKNAWSVCKIDSVVWLVTFSAVVVFDVDFGLAIGLLATIASVVFQSRTPKSSLIGLIPGTEIYADVAKYEMASEIPGMKVFRFYAAPYFANKDFFRKELFRHVGLNPIEILAKQKRFNAKMLKQKLTGLPMEASLMRQEKVQMSDGANYSGNNSLEVHSVIIDCSNWNFIDTAGISTIAQVIEEYHAIGVAVYLSGCLDVPNSDPVLETFEKCISYEKVFEKCIFPTIGDVCAHIAS